jgi:predicted nuclease with TOPRIM domain
VTQRTETVLDLIVLIQQKAQDYMDLKSKLAEELDEIIDLLEQLESRIPLLSAFSDTQYNIEGDEDGLESMYPEGITESLDRLRRTYEDYLRGTDLHGG